MGDVTQLFSMGLGLQGAAGDFTKAGAINRQGEFTQSMYDANARIAEMQGQDAIRRGDKEASNLKKASKRMIGTQRAALAAQGIEIDSGSAADIQTDTAELAAQDVLTIKNNAWREAWGYRVQANDLRGKGKYAKAAAENEAASTMLTGGLKFFKGAADSGYFSGSTKPKVKMSDFDYEG